jgi:hypothetical protein
VFTIQVLDHEEGSGARWFELQNCRRETREETRILLREIRAKQDEWCLYSYRVVEVDSAQFYSQPTDSFEW